MGKLKPKPNNYLRVILRSKVKRLLDLPSPNIHSAIVSNSKGDEEKLAVGLALHTPLNQRRRVDNEVKQTIICEFFCTERLERRFGISIDIEKQLQQKVKQNKT